MDSTDDLAAASSITLRNTLLAELPSSHPSAVPPVSSTSPTPVPRYPTLSSERAALSDAQRGTVLYLAYGSNLCHETFQGKRGIRPLSAINVQVPTLRLTFDLPGLPYAEPCFANSGRRDPSHPSLSESTAVVPDEKTALLSTTSAVSAPQPKSEAGTTEYNKDRWKKGLIGIVYEVTPADYTHIIATEGGGSSYHDILVPCHPLPTTSSGAPDPGVPVPDTPTTPPFVAHTLFSPRVADGEPPKDGGRFQRPDPGYAQPSARYLKLITDGAAEHSLPLEYQRYLASLQPYTITSNKQRLGQFIFLSLWGPFVFFVFALQKLFSDEKGKSPAWLVALTGALFKGVWASYDGYFKGLFGDGERTVEGDDGGEGSVDRCGSQAEGGRGAWRDCRRWIGSRREERGREKV